MPRLRPVIANCALLAVSVVASLLAFEGLLRVTTDPGFGGAPPACRQGFFGAGALVFDPVLGWRNSTGPRNSRCETDGSAIEWDAPINSLGFRGSELARDKPPGVLRIACLGDSGTFGILARADESDPSRRIWRPITSYPEALARRLEREGFHHVEVINAGVIGYSSSHGLRLLVLRVLDLDPDVITVRFGANDASRSWAPERRAIEPSSAITTEIFYALADWRLTRLALRAYQSVALFHPEPDSVWWTTEDQFRRNLERMATVSREHEARLLLLDYPIGSLKPRHRPELRDRLPRLQTILRDFSRERGVPLLETRPHLATPEGPLFGEADVVHPTERGAQRIGDLIFEELRSLGWLRPNETGH